MAEYPYSYDTVITGSQPVETTEVVLAGGQDLPALTPLAQKASDGLVYAYDPTASDGREKALYLVPPDADLSTTGQRDDQVIKAGIFNPDMLNWPDSADTVRKRIAFTGSMISLQTPN